MIRTLAVALALVQQTCAVPQATNQLFHIRPLP